MGRIRTVKPELFKSFKLYRAEESSGLPLRTAYPALFTVADREGRFRWQPQELKLECLPYDPVNFADVLDALEAGDYVRRYEVDGKVYGYIPSWHDHQRPNVREAKSVCPPPPKENVAKPAQSLLIPADTRQPNLTDRNVPAGERTCMHVHIRGEGKGREGKGKEERVPRAEIQLSAEFVWSGITDDQKNRWRESHPAVDVDLELRRMADWIQANPSKRKKNWPKFIVSWLGRSQDSGGSTRAGRLPSNPIPPKAAIRPQRCSLCRLPLTGGFVKSPDGPICFNCQVLPRRSTQTQEASCQSALC